MSGLGRLFCILVIGAAGWILPPTPITEDEWSDLNDPIKDWGENEWLRVVQNISVNQSLILAVD